MGACRCFLSTIPLKNKIIQSWIKAMRFFISHLIMRILYLALLREQICYLQYYE